jgi:hypothetical protein
MEVPIISDRTSGRMSRRSAPGLVFTAIFRPVGGNKSVTYWHTTVYGPKTTVFRGSLRLSVNDYYFRCGYQTA